VAIVSDMSLPSGLAAALHPGQMRRARPTDAIDEVQPSYVLTVRGEDDLVRVVDEARNAKLAIVAVGGATRLHVGNIAEAVDLRVSLGGMASILEHSPEDMTVTVEAGVSLSRLNHALAKHGQRICIDDPNDDRATIGGTIATNSTGGYAYGFGTPRDLVLGMTLIDGKARLLRAGGKVVKNVSGYDLVRLFTGSYGSLGIIAGVTLRTHPIPEYQRCLEFVFDDHASLESLRAQLYASNLPLACLDFAHDRENARWRAVVRIEGTKKEVEYQKGRIESLAGRDGRPFDGPSPVYAGGKPTVIVRINASPTSIVEVSQLLSRVVGNDRTSVTLGGRLGDGVARIASSEGDVKRALNFVRTVGDCARKAGAGVVVERAPREIKRILDVWGERPGGFALMRRVKDAFDPSHILSPGRFVGRL